MVVHEYVAELDISEPPHSEPVWAGMCEFDNVSEALNEIVKTYYPLCGKGFGSTEVTGMHPVYTFTGRRKIGDKLQDWLFAYARKFAIGEDRHTKFRIKGPTVKGTTEILTAPATLANLMEISGSTTDESNVSVEVHVNGKFELTQE